MIDIRAIRTENPLPPIVAATVKLQRTGKEWKGCCPFHPDRSPSFTIFADGERFHCFGCGANGDVLDYVAKLHGTGMVEAARLLCAGDLPMVEVPTLHHAARTDRSGEALAIWRSAVSAVGTDAEAYLRLRGIDLPIPAALRFAHLRYGRSGPLHPALVALVSGVDDRPIGIQRTYLAPYGLGKADVPKAKLSLGAIRGGAIRLGDAQREIMVCEGLEDGLSLHHESGLPVWVSAGTSNLPAMAMPPVVRSIIIGRDNDDAGRLAAAKAANAFADRGLAVRIIAPADGHKDFNSELQEAL